MLEEAGGSPATEDDVALLVVKLVAVPARLDIEIAAEAAALAGLRRRLRRWLALRGVGEDDREDAILAISEACSNSIEHGYERGEGAIQLTIEHAAGALKVVVRDRGRWRMRGRGATGRGRGLVIMRSRHAHRRRRGRRAGDDDHAREAARELTAHSQGLPPRPQRCGS